MEKLIEPILRFEFKKIYSYKKNKWFIIIQTLQYNNKRFVLI